MEDKVKICAGFHWIVQLSTYAVTWALFFTTELYLYIFRDSNLMLFKVQISISKSIKLLSLYIFYILKKIHIVYSGIFIFTKCKICL